MRYYIEILIDRLEWIEDDYKLESKYRNMTMEVIVHEEEVINIEGFVYNNDDWDIMYELGIDNEEIKKSIKEKFLT